MNMTPAADNQRQREGRDKAAIAAGILVAALTSGGYPHVRVIIGLENIWVFVPESALGEIAGQVWGNAVLNGVNLIQDQVAD